MNLLLSRFKEYLFSQNTTPSKVTVKNYLSDISHFIRWFQDKTGTDFNATSITFEFIQQYKNENSDKLSSSSLERHLSSLRKFFKFLKDEDIVKTNIFEQAQVEKIAQIQDPFRLKDFKNFLFKSNSSHLTIKNYIIDVKQFLVWAKQVLSLASDEQVLGNINAKVIEEYKARLTSEGGFSPATVNRKLSSLRRYTAWASAENLIFEKNYSVANISKAKQPIIIPEPQSVESETKQIAKSYSNFPPLRFAQKLGAGASLIFDTAFINPLAALASKGKERFWHFRGQPVFKKTEQSLVVKNITHKDLLGIKNISKKLYAPFQLSEPKGLINKIIFHAKFTRPKWYIKYHSYAIAHYINFAILVIFLAGIGFGIYDSFFAKPQQQSPALAALPTAPPRILSFQGRLTDINDNPITAVTNIRFAIYNDPSASGSALLWEEVNNVSPDTDGIFNSLLGNNSAIPSSLFAENAALYLGVTIESTPELTPRQQLATVAYAANSETLQGLQPITAGGAGTSNVVLALDSSGNLTIGGSANPTFTASGGTFKLSGQPLLLTTNTGTDSNVQIVPDGLGKINVEKPLVNTSNSGNISTVPGSVQINDEFSVLATSSGRSAFTLNQDSTGPLISASTSGTAMFTVDNSGNTTIAGNTTVQGTTGLTLSGSGADIAFTGGGNTDITSTGTLRIGAHTLTGAITGNNQSITGLNDLSAAGTVTFSDFNANNNVLYATVSTGVLAGASTNTTGLCLVSGASSPSWTTCPGGTSNLDVFWNQASGALFPNNSTVDFLVGGQATTSAKFAVLNINSGTPVASISANSGNIATYLTGDGTLATTNRQSLTIGNSSTYNTSGNVLINPNGTGLVGIGTSSPSSVAPLTISRSAIGIFARFDKAGGGDNIGFVEFTSASVRNAYLGFGAGGVGNNNFSIVNTLNADLVFGTNNTDRAVISETGNLGVGDLSPAALLTVGSGDLFQVDSSGAIAAATGITSSGTITLSAFTSNGGVLYTNGSGVLAQATAGTATQCLLGGTTPSFGSCSTGFVDPYWQQASGAIFPNNSTVDFLVGGQSTTSALFSFTGVSNLSHQTKASISGQLIVMPNNGFGNVGIGDTTPIAPLTVGSGDLFQVDSTGAIAAVTGITTSGGYAQSGSGINTLSGATTISSTGTALTLSGAATTAINISNTGVTTDISLQNGETIHNDTNGRITFGGADILVGDNDILDSGATTRISLGTTTTLTNTTTTLSGTTTITASNLTTFTTAATLAFSGDITITGNDITNTTLNLGGGSAATIGTVSNDDLSIIPHGTGALNLATTNTGAVAIGNGTGTFSLNSNTLDISTGGAITGATGITSSGTITFSGLNGQNAVLYGTQTTGVVAQATTATSGQCLLSGSSSPSWATCPGGADTTDVWWNQTNGALYPNNSTVDFLIGGQSTSSAEFTFTGVSDVNNQTQASISGQLIVMPNNGYSGKVGIGTTTPSALVDVLSTNSLGSLMNLYWNPSSATIVTSDLLSLDVGANGTLGNIFNVKDNGSSVFSVSQSQVTSNLPTSFNAVGDVSIAYDINFTNPTASYIKSQAPLYITAGEQFNSSNLVLETYNKGNIVTNTEAFVINGSATMSGQLLIESDQNQEFLILKSTNSASGVGDAFINDTGNYFGWALGGSNSQFGSSYNDLFYLWNDQAGIVNIAFTSTGNVGIRTTSPDSSLHVIGGLCVESSDSGCAATSGTVFASAFHDVNNSSYYIDPAGGTSANLSGNIAMEGTTITASNLTTFTTAATLAFSGDIRINGNDILDSAGTTRLTLGATNTVTGNLNVSGLTASRLVATDASKNLVSTITMANLESSVSDASNILISTEIDTCAELAALTATTGTCGSFVLSASPTFTGTITAAAANFSGAIAATTLDTGQGANELYDMNQNVLTTSAVTFATVNTGQGANELYDMNQNVTTSSAVDFTNLDITATGNSSVRLGNTDVDTATNVDISYNNSSSGCVSCFVLAVENTNGTANQNIMLVQAGVANSTANTWFITFRDSDEAIQGEIQGGAGNSISYTSASDRRFKENIVTTHFSIEDLMKIQVRDYNWKSTGEFATGFIAQELYEIYPEAVSVGGDDVQRDPWSVDYGKVTPIIVKGVQDQQIQINAQRGRIDNFESDLAISNLGNLSIIEQNPDQFIVKDSTRTVNRIAALAHAFIGNLRAGLINTRNIVVSGTANVGSITTGSINVTSDSVKIAGQNLRNYITAIVNDVLNSRNLVSPIASIDTLNTDVISPLGDKQESKVAVRLNDNEGKSKLEVQNASGSAVASFDSSGNATLSGSLSADSASIAGTLRAQKIIADQIEGLNVNAATISANYITNNYYLATQSADPFPTLPASPSSGVGSFSFDSGEYINIATFSSQLAYVDNLNSQTAVFNQNLTSYGYTTLSDTSIVGQLAINGTLILADNSINVLGQDLSLQPLKQGGISLMAGLIYIDTNGNAKFGSDVTIEGTLYANVISPIPGSDLKINLATGSSVLASGSDGSEILKIDELGNLIASGAGTFSKINLATVQPALADGNELIASGSAGIASIAVGKKEIIINNSIVTENSLIYITPVGQSVQTPYLVRQKAEESFTVGVSNVTLTEIKFNWLIIN